MKLYLLFGLLLVVFCDVNAMESGNLSADVASEDTNGCRFEDVAEKIVSLESTVDLLNYRLSTGGFGGCSDVFTGFEPYSAAPIMYLDRHDVSCQQGYFLARFVLNRWENRDDADVRYVYKCCKIPF